MTRMLCLFAAALLATGVARAQTQVVQTTASPVVEVQRIAPQLVQFAGSDVNFANLVNGLSFGLPVTLTTSVAPGVTQIVNFTPSGTLTALQIAQLLESARQTAIANGIATPTAEQVAVILNGGTLPTATGTTTISGLMTGTAGTAIGAVQSQSTASPTVTLQNQRSFTVSNSPFPRGISDTPSSGTSTAVGTTTSVTGTTSTTGTTAPQPLAPLGTVTAPGAIGAAGGTAGTTTGTTGTTTAPLLAR